MKALITGAASGIGLALSREFAARGYEVILIDINKKAVTKAAIDLRSGGAQATAYVCDVSDQQAVDALAERVAEELGPVDILVNNAGIAFMKEFKDMTMEEWDRVMGINLWGPIYMTRAFLPSMMARRSGHIVNVSSMQAYFIPPTWSAYGVTKYGVNGLSEALRYELRPYNIKVTCVYPAIINTPFYEALPSDIWVLRATKILIRKLVGTSPERLARLIIEGVEKGKARIVHHPVGKLVYFLRPLVTPMLDLTQRIVARLVCERPST
jgi:NAD(P)-dependent dehydrogenase (short-subunit alcohol dehydrogenase family)